MTINQTAPVTDEELDQLIWGLERYGLYPRQLAALKELREVRRAKGEPVAIVHHDEKGFHALLCEELPEGTPLYSVPQLLNDAERSELQEHRKAVATPIYQLFDMGWYDTNKQTHDNAVSAGCAGRIVYTAKPELMKDHQIRELVNDLRDIAIEYHGTQQLRDRISRTVRAAMLQSSGNSERLEPVSNRDELPTNSFTNEDLAGMSHGDNPQANAYRELLAFRRNSPATPDGWVMVSERMPERGVDVLACKKSPFGGYEEIETAQWHGGMKGERPVFITSADTIEPEMWHPLPATPNFREISNSSTNNCREITETSTNCHKCGGRGTYHCPQMLGTVECECTLPATAAPLRHQLGYAIINVSIKPHPGDTVLISYCGRIEFAIVQGGALIVPEGEAIEGEALDDTTVHGVVTHFLNRVVNQQADTIPVM